MEIATYIAIERLASSVGDKATQALADSIRADKQKMLDRISREIPKLTEVVVREEKTVEVTAERRLVEVRQGTTVRSVNAAEIRNLPVQTVTDTDTSLYRFTASLGDFTVDGKPDVACKHRATVSIALRQPSVMPALMCFGARSNAGSV